MKDPHTKEALEAKYGKGHRFVIRSRNEALDTEPKTPHARAPAGTRIKKEPR